MADKSYGCVCCGCDWFMLYWRRDSASKLTLRRDDKVSDLRRFIVRYFTSIMLTTAIVTGGLALWGVLGA